MIRHYLTVAFRNLRKYGSQTLVSVVGLAVGFACFALAALWIRYEMTYDGFHRDADRIYCVRMPNRFLPTEHALTRMASYPLAGRLRADFPEIEYAAAVIPGWPGVRIEIDGAEFPAQVICVDSAFFGMFDVRIVEGSRDFLIPDSKKMAVTQSKARQLFGDESPLGKKIRYREEYTVCAVVTDMPKRSTYAFDFLHPFYAEALNPARQWNRSQGENILVRLAPGADPEAFGKKLYAHEIHINEWVEWREMILTPITQLRYVAEDIPRDIRFTHILVFALAGLLLILCTLFNYLTLFVSRFRIRQKEMALRKVCGASGWSLFALLSVEVALSLSVALLTGLLLVWLLHEPFCRLSEIRMSLSSVCGEAAGYAGAVAAVTLAIFLPVMAAFRRRPLQAALHRSHTGRFRRLSVVVQLLAGIGFIFCTTVILKQMYHLRNTDLGFDFRNSGSVITVGMKPDLKALKNHLGEIPEIEEAFPAYTSLLPQAGIRESRSVTEWDGKQQPEEAMLHTGLILVSEQYLSFYGLRLTEGEMLRDSDPKETVLINEAASRTFGWDEPVGKSFESDGQKYTVKGVVKNTFHLTPTVSPAPCFFASAEKSGYSLPQSTLLFRYRPGTWKACRAKLEQAIRKVYPDLDGRTFQIVRAEDAYADYLKSENALLKLLGFVSAACVVVCVFGFVSLISLTCEERRREMAIRKINGATVHNLLAAFFRENFRMLLAGSALAFLPCYFLMRRWLEQYVIRTDVPAWIYLSIVLLMALVIVLCVGRRVYRAGIENPAAVVKSE